jgi:3'-5' exoribonuclease 1
MAILLDLEATCWDKNDKCCKANSEIIQISAVSVNRNFIIESVFSEYIKPIKNQQLSKYCMELTGIEQRDVDVAPSFNTVINKFNQWLIEHREKVYYPIVIWGNSDKLFLQKSLRLNKCNGEINKYLLQNKLYDLQSKFMEFMYLENKISLTKSLAIIGEPFNGKKHDALIDVKNMIKIYRFLGIISKENYRKHNYHFVQHIEEIRQKNKQIQDEKKEIKRQKQAYYENISKMWHVNRLINLLNLRICNLK